MLHPQPGWSELDSAAIWRQTQAVIAEVAAQSAHDPITALAVSAFGEAFVPVSKDRNILDRSILCVDDRGREHIARLTETFGPEQFYAINPNLPGPHYSLPKLLWLREHRPDVFQRADYFLLWSDLIAFLLGGEPVTNNSHANRTLLFDLAKNDWSEELLGWSGIPREKLGRVVSGGTVIGKVSDALADELHLPRDVHIVAGGHDQCCNALGCGSVAAGKTICGIGSFECLTPVFHRPSQPLALLAEGLNVEHHVLPDLFVTFIWNQSGLLVKWFRDTFAAGCVPPANTDLYTLLDREMPDAPTRLLVLPHFEPPVSPRIIPDTSGVIVGLKLGTTRGEILKALVEGASLYFVESLGALARLGLATQELIASGGGAQSDRGLQIRADVFGLPVIRPRITEAGRLGAAMLAGLATGVFRTAHEAATLFVKYDRVFEPDAARHARYGEKHALYQQLFPALRPVLHKLSGSSR
jgi:xylulokinase